MSTITVLYQDNHLIAVIKPAGVLSQGDVTGDDNMLHRVKLYLKQTYNKPGNVFLGLLHRLDRPVSGIMLFAKTSKGASRLSEQFRNHTIGKTYQAIVVGKPPQQKGVLVNRLIKDEKLKKGRENADGQEARLFYEVLQSRGNYSLLSIAIEGGKFHQIRTQLALAGFPILGDVKYKGQPWADEQSIALCATGLSFIPATTEEMVTLSLQTPKAWAEYLT